MKHRISEEEWDDYLNGKSAPPARARLDAHLLGCSECWQRYQREYPVMRALQSAVGEAREDLVLDQQRLQPMFANIMAGIRADAGVPAAEIDDGLKFLDAVLEPVFGRSSAQRAMHLAADLSPAHPLSQMTRENWNCFLERLATIASIVCGDVFAGLIRKHGQLSAATL